MINQIAFDLKGKCLYINKVVQHFNEKVTTPFVRMSLRAMKQLVSP